MEYNKQFYGPIEWLYNFDFEKALVWALIDYITAPNSLELHYNPTVVSLTTLWCYIISPANKGDPLLNRESAPIV